MFAIEITRDLVPETTIERSLYDTYCCTPSAHDVIPTLASRSTGQRKQNSEHNSCEGTTAVIAGYWEV